MTDERRPHPNGSMFWSIPEETVCFEEYQRGIGWEERAAARLEGRTVAAIVAHAKLMHLRTTGWMQQEMKRMGMRGGDA